MDKRLIPQIYCIICMNIPKGKIPSILSKPHCLDILLLPIISIHSVSSSPLRMICSKNEKSLLSFFPNLKKIRNNTLVIFAMSKFNITCYYCETSNFLFFNSFSFKNLMFWTRGTVTFTLCIMTMLTNIITSAVFAYTSY
jgi:hypothetical protein